MGDITLPTWGLKDAYLKEAQSKDALCQRIFAQAAKNGEKAIHPYYVEILRCVRNVHMLARDVFDVAK